MFIYQRYMRAPLSPRFSAWLCACVWANSGQSVTSSGEPLCWCGQILRLRSCKEGRRFPSEPHINSRGGVEVCVKDGVIGIMNEEKSAFLLIVFGSECVTACDRATERWGQSRRGAPQTAARRKLTTNMPDCGRRAPGRLLSSLAVWPQWVEGWFFFPFHFLSPPHRKETCCRCLGHSTGGLHSAQTDWNSRRPRVLVIVSGRSRPDTPHNFNQDQVRQKN